MIPGRLAILDVETTGADPRADRVTEVGLLLIDDGVLVEEWASLVNPGRCIPTGIEALTGISTRMVERAPAFDDLAVDLAQRLDGRVLVAHNARFDYAFLRGEFRRAGMTFHSDALCTVRLSRRLAPAERRHNLDALIARYALASDGRHRALPDARLVHRLLGALHEQVGAPALLTAVDAVVTRPLDATLPAPLDDLPDAPGAYLLYATDGAPLLSGKAANLRTQVLAHLGERGTRGREQRAALQAGAIEWTATAGELGAALRHLRNLREHAPRHNRRSRDSVGGWGLQWQPQDQPQVAIVNLDEGEGLTLGDLCGPFRSPADALAALRGIARDRRLCAAAVGLAPAGAACPPEHACGGACTGRESHAAHTLRMIEALARLRMAAWPFRGAVALVEEDRAGLRAELHVAQDWRHLGSVTTPADIPAVLAAAGRRPPFDVEVYRLLQRALATPERFRVVELPGAAGSARDAAGAARPHPHAGT